MSTLEQRRRFAEKIGDRVQGTTGGHLRIMDRGATCDGCGGQLPCIECDTPAEDAPGASRSAAVVVPDHTAAARQRLALVRAQGRKPRSAA